MTEITDLSPTDSSNTSVTGESLDGSIANMGRMDNTLQAILGMFGRWTSSDTIASAGTTDIGAQAEAYLTVSGTTAITSFGTVRAGTIRVLQFSGILTLTYNATSLILPGAASITTAAGDTAVFVSEGSGNWRCLVYNRASGTALVAPTVLLPPDYVQGLTLSNNSTDTNNDIDIAIGSAKSGSTTVTNSGVWVKRLDATFAAGTNQGGLDTGSKANSSTYHVHALRKDSDGTFDALFSLSPTAPTVPTGYTRIQRLGAVITDGSGNIRGFVQRGNKVVLKSAVADYTGGQRAMAVLAITVPSGVIVRSIHSVNISLRTGDDSGVTATLSDGNDATAKTAILSLIGSGIPAGASMAESFTNTSRQINASFVLDFGSQSGNHSITTLGWEDCTIPRTGA